MNKKVILISIVMLLIMTICVVFTIIKKNGNTSFDDYNNVNNTESYIDNVQTNKTDAEKIYSGLESIKDELTKCGIDLDSVELNNYSVIDQTYIVVIGDSTIYLQYDGNKLVSYNIITGAG